MIELLVVIAVIAILAAMLLSALSRARAAAESAYCKSNLRQWGHAFRMYLNDFKVYPPAWTLDQPYVDAHPPPGRTWFEMLQPYTRANWKTVKAGDPLPIGIHVCPGYVHIGGRTWLRGFFDNYGCYAYNETGYMGDANLGLSWLNPPPTLDVNASALPEGEVACPSDMFAMGDAILGPGTASTGPEAWDLLEPAGVPTPFFELGLPGYSREMDWNWRRHGGCWNVLFCDGHVEGLKTKQLLDPRSDAVLRRWHRDHSPHADNVGVTGLRRILPP